MNFTRSISENSSLLRWIFPNLKWQRYLRK
jgi:hypothetical protein